METMHKIGRVLRRAIDCSLERRPEALAYAGRFGRGLEAPLTDRFVSMYVNERTRDCGEDGRRAILRLLDEGRSAGVISTQGSSAVEFVPLAVGPGGPAA
jgi:predicted solute-binding protein